MNGQKKLPIKTNKVKAPKKHGEPYQDTIIRLELAIKQIQNKLASQLSFEEHYRYAYNLVLHRHGHILYNKVSELITNHLEFETLNRIVSVFPPNFNKFNSSTNNELNNNAKENIAMADAGALFLDRIREVWIDHIACMSKLRDVLKYMDKVYTGTPTVPATWDLGLSLFFHRVILFSTNPIQPSTVVAPIRSTPSSSSSSSRTNLNQPPVTPKPLPTTDSTTVAYHLITTLLNVIRIERQGEVISRHSISSIVEILMALTDEGPIALPLAASTGTGSGIPQLGVGSGGSTGRGKAVMGIMSGTSKIESPYSTSFERAFLTESENFYKKESEVLLFECDAPGYLIKIQRRLSEEAERAQSYLSASTEPLLIALLEKVLIETHLDAILDHPASGLSTLIQDSRLEDLERLYTLFGRVIPGHDALQKSVAEWITRVGKQVNEGLLVIVAEVEAVEEEESIPNPNDPKGKGKAKAGTGSAVDLAGAKGRAALSWVENVLALKDKFETILVEAFHSDKAFEKSINDAFTVFVNQNVKAPEYISLFVDENLKKGLKGKSEAEVDVVLNKTVSLFRFLIEKDRFERYYNSHLAKRLISSRSVSDDAERNMLAKFKIEAGAAFTKSAEGMMQDVKISQDALVEYKRHQERQAVKAPFEMATTVCGQNFWPFDKGEAACVLPPILLSGIESFKAFYDIKHSGRILTFRPEMGTVELKVKFKTRSHELTLSTHAMIVLVLFDGMGDDEQLSYKDIAEATRMIPAELVRTLQTVACGKFKLLTKIPKGRDVNETDHFAFNSAFTSPMAKIKIPTVASKVETVEEGKETDNKVDEARNSLCEAAIVRVMKDRKTLMMTELVTEVIKQLLSRFGASPTIIKRAIDRLIEREFLERDEIVRSKLRYMA